MGHPSSLTLPVLALLVIPVGTSPNVSADVVEALECDLECRALFLVDAIIDCPGLILDYVFIEQGSYVLLGSPNADGTMTVSYYMVQNDAPSGIPGLLYLGWMGLTQIDRDNPFDPGHKHFAFAAGNPQGCIEVGAIDIGSPFGYSIYGGYLGIQGSASCTVSATAQAGFPQSHVSASISCTATITTNFVTRIDNRNVVVNGALLGPVGIVSDGLL